MASRPQLPERDWESMARRGGRRARSSRRSPAASRSPAPSRRRSRCCSTCCSRLEPERARLRARHARALPRDVRRLARGRAPLRHEGRGLRGPIARAAGRGPRRRALGAQPDLCCAIRKVEPLGRALDGLDALDHRPAARPVADARRRAQGRLGRGPRALEGEPARRLGRPALLGLHPRARAALQRAARPRLRLDRLHALHEARRRPRGPLGRARQDRVRPAHGGPKHERASSSGSPASRPPASRRSPASSPPSSRRAALLVDRLDGDVVREHLTKGLGFSKEDRDTNIEPHRLGRLAPRPRRRRRRRVRDLALRGGAAAGARARRGARARSSRSTSRRRSRSASAATQRGSTARRTRARSPSSRASPTPTRARRTPS